MALRRIAVLACLLMVCTVLVAGSTVGSVHGDTTIIAGGHYQQTGSDVISGGGTVSNLLPVAGSNGVQYTATYTAASTAGTVLIGVDSAKFTDAAGNLNKDTYANPATGTDVYEANNQVSVPFNTDNTPPGIVVGRIGTGNLVGTTATASS